MMIRGVLSILFFFSIFSVYSQEKCEHIFQLEEPSLEICFPGEFIPNKTNKELPYMRSWWSAKIQGENDVIEYRLSYGLQPGSKKFHFSKDAVYIELKDYLTGYLRVYGIKASSVKEITHKGYKAIKYDGVNADDSLRAKGAVLFYEGGFLRISIICSEFFYKSSHAKFQQFWESLKLKE